MATIYEDPIGEALASAAAGLTATLQKSRSDDGSGDDQRAASISQPSSAGASPIYPMNVGLLATAKLAVLIGDGAACESTAPKCAKADALVPTSGQPATLKGVFIKSTVPEGRSDAGATACEGPAGIKIVETKVTIEDVTRVEQEEQEGDDSSVQRTVRVGSQEAQDLALEASESVPPLRSPQGRKFHSWLSYFYAGRVSSSSSSSGSPLHESSISPKAMMEIDARDEDQEEEEEEEEQVEEEQRLQEVSDPVRTRGPTKGILKMPKPICSMADLPPPVQKTVFLRQEEVQRLTAFTERHFGHASLALSHRIATGQQQRHQQPQSGRRAKLQWNFEATTYHEAFGRSEYERGGVEYVAKCLTPELAMMIKRELNEVKREMPIHEESRHHTQFYALR